MRAFQGIWLLTWKSRLSPRQLPSLIAWILAIPLLAYFTLPAQPQAARAGYFFWTVNFFTMLVVPLYCLSAFGALIRDEIQADTLRFLITRPVKRLVLFALKFVCLVIFIELIVLSCALLLLGVGFAHKISDLGSFCLWFLGSQVLAVLAYGGLSALLGLTNKRYLVVGVVYGFIVEAGIGLIPTNINNISISRHLRTLLANHPAVRDLYSWVPDGTSFSALMLLAGTVLFVAAGAALFTLREYHPADEMQK